MEFRKNNVKKLRQEIQKIFNLKTAEFLEKLLNDYEVPSGKIRTIPEVVTEEQFLARKLWNKIYINNLNKEFLVPSIGFKVDKASSHQKNLLQPWEDTVSILNSIGYNDTEIDVLRNKAVIK